MRLFLLGATGNSGRRIVKFALQRGHQVTAFVRDQKKLAEILGRSLPQGLQVVVGDIDKSAELGTAMGGHDVVINAAGYVTEGDRFTTLDRESFTKRRAALGRAAASGNSVARRFSTFRVPVSKVSTYPWSRRCMKRIASP